MTLHRTMCGDVTTVRQIGKVLHSGTDGLASKTPAPTVPGKPS